MIPVRFLLFSLGFAAILYLHFVLAHRAWHRLKGQPALQLDRGYVRFEDYFARSFRLKVNGWLKSANGQAAKTGETVTSRAGERLRCLENLKLTGGNAEDAVLVIHQDVECGPACVFTREVYVHGEGRIGDRSELQAIAADGKLALGAEVTVGRWVDSEGDLEIGAGCSIGGRASSRGTLYLHRGARARSVFGILVQSDNCAQAVSDSEPEPPEEYIPIPLDAAARLAIARKKKLTGFDASRLSELSSDTWIYKGDLRPVLPLNVKTKLIVKGDCTCPAGTVLEDDLKVSGSLDLGSESVANGGLVAAQDIRLGSNCRFHGVIHAGKSLRLGAGSQGYRKGGQVAAFAGSILYLEEGVAVSNGKLAAGEYVLAVV